MTQSKRLFAEAQAAIPSGVNSPVRAFRGVEGEPIFINRGHGAYLVDVDGREYVDYVCSWGPLIAGHAHPVIKKAVAEALENGFSFGAPTEIEVKLAKKVTELMPNIELIRFVSSGTEAAMSAIRLARGFTKRNKIIKFAGCYHGHADSMLVAAGSGGLTFGMPSSAGVPKAVAEDTLIATYNSLSEVEALFEANPGAIAGVIVEPVAGNMNLVLPAPGFLQGLAELCRAHGALLIFDEVITGFRVAKGGAQAYFDVEPDLTILGKIVGGGFPAAAFGGRKEIMEMIAPLGPVYQAGTLSGNPIAMTAGLASLEFISQAHFYENLATKTTSFLNTLESIASQYSIPFHATSIGSMFGLFFDAKTKIVSEADVKACDIALFRRFFHGMLKAGVYFAPSAFEIGFVSAAHDDQAFEKTFSAAHLVFAELKTV